MSENKKNESQDLEVKDEALDEVAGGAGGSPKPTATPCLDPTKQQSFTYGKRG